MAKKHLYPLLMKPGVLRDGTGFQGEYATDSQWVRFQRGLPRTIGGYVSFSQVDSNQIETVFSFSIKNNSYVCTFIRPISPLEVPLGRQGLFLVRKNQEKSSLIFIKICEPNEGDVSVLVKGPVFYKGQYHILLNKLKDRNNINSDATSTLYLLPLIKIDQLPNPGTNIEPYRVHLEDIPPPYEGDISIPNGGMEVIQSRIFVFGENGLVAWSSADDMKDFRLEKDVVEQNGEVTGQETTGAGVISVSSDKVINAALVRGGAQSPCILVWTLSSLLKLVNVSDESQNLNPSSAPSLEFKTDTVAKKISVMSRSSIVEYDGLFFWPGIDRFYVYNGTVQDLPNSLNLNWFFDNVLLSRRQNICGVLNPKFNEIWWFYSDKRDADSEFMNTRVIIYNKRENTWYDSILNRDAAFFDCQSGKLLAAGRFDEVPLRGDYSCIFQHEVGTHKEINMGGGKRRGRIKSSLTSPVISLTSIGPGKEEVGIDRYLVLNTIEPDFTYSNTYDNAEPTIEFALISKKYPQSPKVTEALGSLTPKLEFLNINKTSRQVQVKLSSESGWEMGKPLISFSIGGEL